MPDIKIYSSKWCPYCVRAKALLKQKGAPFNEISVDEKREIRAQMTAESGRTSVPQIWINDTHIGGCDELYELEQRGQLDALLGR